MTMIRRKWILVHWHWYPSNIFLGDVVSSRLQQHFVPKKKTLPSSVDCQVALHAWQIQSKVTILQVLGACVIGSPTTCTTVPLNFVRWLVKLTRPLQCTQLHIKICTNCRDRPGVPHPSYKYRSEEAAKDPTTTRQQGPGAIWIYLENKVLSWVNNSWIAP